MTSPTELHGIFSNRATHQTQAWWHGQLMGSVTNVVPPEVKREWFNSIMRQVTYLPAEDAANFLINTLADTPPPDG